jgi:hypothetical protein
MELKKQQAPSRQTFLQGISFFSNAVGLHSLRTIVLLIGSPSALWKTSHGEYDAHHFDCLRRQPPSELKQQAAASQARRHF